MWRRVGWCKHLQNSSSLVMSTTMQIQDISIISSKSYKIQIPSCWVQLLCLLRRVKDTKQILTNSVWRLSWKWTIAKSDWNSWPLNPSLIQLARSQRVSPCRMDQRSQRSPTITHPSLIMSSSHPYVPNHHVSIPLLNVWLQQLQQRLALLPIPLTHCEY